MTEKYDDLHITVCADRHDDIQVRVFDTPEKAIDYAKKIVQGNARHTEDIKEIKFDGWLYYCQYSCEGDSVRVEKVTVNRN